MKHTNPMRRFFAAMRRQSPAAVRLAQVDEGRHIFDTSPDLILVTDTRGNIVRVSPSCEKILGYRPDEMMGRSAQDFIYPGDLAPTREQMRALRRGDKARIFEARYRHKNGGVVTLGWTGAWSSRARKHYFFGRDTTEQKLAEEKFRLAVEASPSGLVMIDANGAIILVNAETERMFGYDRHELIGGPVDILVPQKFRSGHILLRSEFVAAPQARRMGAGRDLKGVRKDGSEFPVEIGLNPIQTSTGLLVLGVILDISERKRNEATIREYAEREQLFIAAVESSNDAIVTKNLDGIVTGWNEAAEHLFGYTADEVIGKSIDIIVPADLRGDVRMILAKIKAGEKIEHHETVRLAKDGRRLDISLSVSPVKSQSGTIIGASKMARDISARKQTLAALIESEKLSRAIIDTALDAFVQLDDSWNIIDWSPQAEATFRWSRDEVVGRNLIDIIIPPENRSFTSGRLAGFLTEAEKGGSGWRYVAPSLRHDGKIINTEISLTAIRRGDRYIINSFIRDITERVQAEKDRDRNREFLDRIVENISVAILVKDARDLQFILVNKAAEELWGLSRDEMLGKTPRQIFPTETADLIERNDRDLLQTGKASFIEEHTILRPDKRTRLVVSRRMVVRDQHADAQHVLVVVEDVTERRAMENQLVQSQKMESIGQLTGGIAHDFNNMLTVITGTIDILTDAVKDKPEMTAIANLISEAADRGTELTGHLLAFARRQPLQPRETDVNALMTESEKFLRRSLGEQIDVELRLASDAWPALVDPTQLTTALVNLAVNARDAMPNGGKLTLETGNAVLDADYAQNNREVVPGSYVVVAVSDTGDGIPEAIRQRVFEPFFTTKEVGKGTGLGLSMVYGFIKQSNGHIKVYSEEGYGTTFKIYLPRAAAAYPTAETPIEAAPEGGSETILLVEDNALVLASATAQLQSLGYRTVKAANAAEALAIADAGAPFDLLFTDVIMPGGMNGRRLAEEMAKRRAPLKVLFTSGYTENAIVHHGRLDPGVHLLAKPYRKSDLAIMVRRALDDAKTFSP